MRPSRRAFLLVTAFSVFEAGAQNAAVHPREAEAVKFANEWLDLVDQGNDVASFELLTSTFQRNLTANSWRQAIVGTNAKLGARISRKLRRVVWYDNSANAPLPGLYAAVEFDSVFENADQHFQYVVLHSQRDEPFRVMRNETTFALKKSPKSSAVPANPSFQATAYGRA